MQNLKLDIIYHQSPSDFEMEFNLRANCPIRLLTDKTDDKKAFVKALARDVARSRVIMCCGQLFGNDGLINTTAKAIGTGTAVCDSKTYGINGQEDIHIINGSTPLVTPDGYFGGCIIESGPQTIILLTENKSFRKAIMKNLIHPYLVEISYIAPPVSPLSAPVTEESPVYETAVSENETYITLDDEYDVLPEPTTPVSETQDEHNIDFIMDGEDKAEDQPVEISPIEEIEFSGMYTEVESTKELKSRYDQPYITSPSDSMFIAERQDDKENIVRKKNNARTMDITIVILIAVLLLAVLALVYLVVLRPASMGVSTSEYIKEIFGIASSNTKV